MNPRFKAHSSLASWHAALIALALSGCAIGPGVTDVGVCGNDAVEIGELCDDGVNDGAYGGCLPDCSGPAAHCGDGIVNGDEFCDSGTPPCECDSRILIPFPSSEDASWEAIEEAADANPNPNTLIAVVLNGQNGPPDAAQLDRYCRGIESFHAHDVRVFGYVDITKDSDPTPPLTALQAEIDSWVDCDGEGGGFADGIYVNDANTRGDDFIRDLAAYARSRGLMTVGTYFANSLAATFVDVLDAWLIHHQAIGMPPLSTIESWHEQFGPDRRAVWATSVDPLSESEFQDIAAASQWIYVTEHPSIWFQPLSKHMPSMLEWLATSLAP